jgi:dienelactone hydrolase
MQSEARLLRVAEALAGGVEKMIVLCKRRRCAPLVIAVVLALGASTGCGASQDDIASIDAGPQHSADASAASREDAKAPTPDAASPGQSSARDAAVDTGAASPRDATTPIADADTRGPEPDASAPRDAAQDAPTGDASVVSPGSGLPAIQDPAQPGPFMVDIVQTAPELSSHMLYVPRELGKGGIKHPIVVWTNGNGASSSYYDAFLRHITTHGFFLVVDKRSTSMRETEYAEQKLGIDWAEKQAAGTTGTYAGKLDGSRIAIMGHSMGSLSSFVNGGDPRVRTTIHWSGGLVGNPTGTDEGALQKLHAPAAFLCGGADTQAGPACANDFRDAPAALPVFYGTLAGVGHLGVFGDRNGGEYGRMGVAWLRWKLAGDESFRTWFVGSSCTACMRPWTGMSKGL